ncbi:putative N-acetylmannosamine-6-phosphate 2-epimerase [Caprobacter fermentans]|uniref:Putative N-acetylmannosamine-6-phosphate 2-epimerase n=1 Tax=Caproicibacter fermentans TaxID=2576756 RepID=A0A6N8HW50_9FIRM|nr:N-acetylmannosamine-6-phosphate 2-epimerase [Caproicibacter fermentans]MVB10044.1 putative N-acetylmannosamine-6-phosphate 2-epimerase [Caproicibacter fermentans]OCN02561.1 N-acetylmannosamine-6-phosphate 2-epimerase [Clostridium sp. W14A]QNK42009.1 N-acetylmannosamine-6-phosphate 2-epimerase [Caproicibacter fermentans]
MKKNEVLNRLRGGLVVSCQALETEPLHSPKIMARMASAAQEGGAVGIRANSPDDIAEIRRAVDLPIIGLHKVDYPDSEVYLTPTMKEVDGLVKVGADIIAVDATARMRPGRLTLREFFTAVKQKYPDRIFMADTSCYEEGVEAKALGFDLVGTTLSGYTEYTRDVKLPNFDLMKKYAETLGLPIVAEGGIWTPEQLRAAFDLGVWTAVVGTAITRPREITRRFVDAMRVFG